MKIYNADFFGRHLLSGSISELGNDTSYSGSFKGNLNGTASYAVTASYLLGLIASASFATNALTASYFDGFIESASYSTYAVSSSYALTASHFPGTVNSSSHSNNANTASYYGGNVISSSYSLSSSYTNKSSLSDSSTTSSHSNQSTSASYYGGSVISSSYALSASWSPGSNSISSSYSVSSSFSNKTSLADSATTSSHANQSTSASYYGGSVISSSYSLSSSYAPPFPTSSYSLQALSASYAPGSPSVSSSYSVSSSFANKSSLADSSTSSSYSTLAMGSIFSKSLFADIKNVSGGTITKGMVISVSSTDVDAGYASVTLGEQSISDNSNKVIGVVYSNSIADTAYGYAIIRGLITGIDTSANMAGDVLYLRNAGLFESGEPAWPNHSVRIGICLVSDPTNGIILVHPNNGYQFNELHDVSINSPQYGDLISISNSGTYINSKFLTGSYTISGSLTVPQLIGTSSYALMAATASYLLGSISSASYATTAQTASYFNGVVVSSSYSISSSYAPPFPTSSYSLMALSASWAPSTDSISSSYSLSSSYSNKSGLSDSSTSASMALNSNTASYFGGSVSTASYSLFTQTANEAFTSSWATNAISSSYYGGSIISSSYSISSSFSNKSSLSDSSTSSSYAVSASWAPGGISESSSYATSASFANKASLADSATSASAATNANSASYYGGSVISSSYSITSSFSNKSSLSDSATNATSASYAPQPLTSSYSLMALSASYAPGAPSVSASYAGSSSYSDFAATASYLLGSIASASHSEYAETASYISGTVTSASYAITASYALNGGSSAGPTVINSLMLDVSQHDWNPTGIDSATIVRLCGRSQMSDLTGMISQSSSTVKTLFNTGSYPIVIAGNHPSSSAANRFELGQDLYLAPNRSVQVLYDTNRWQIISPPLPPVAGFIEYLVLPGSITSGDYAGINLTQFNTGTITNFVGTNAIPVGWALSTSTTTNGGYCIQTVKGGAIAGAGIGHISSRYKITIETLSDVTNEYKLWLDHSTTATGELAANSYGVRYSYNSSSGNFEGYSIDGSSVVSSIDLGVTADVSIPYVIEIELNKRLSEIRFYINDTFCGSLNSNMPAGGTAVRPRSFLRKAVGPTARRVIIHEMYTRILM